MGKGVATAFVQENGRGLNTLRSKLGWCNTFPERTNFGHMNRFPPFILLLTSLAGCHAAAPDPAPVDPLLGHWQADTERLVRYSAAGTISHDTTIAHRQELDFTATTYTKVDYAPTGVNAPVPTRGSGPYTRTGEAIGFGGNFTPLPARLYVRALTPAGFTLEAVSAGTLFGTPPPPGGYSFVAFHR